MKNDLKQAVSFYQQNNLEVACNLCEEIISKNPTSSKTYHLLASIYVKQDRYDLASKYFQLAIQNDAADQLLLRDYANHCFRLGNYSEAKNSYQKAINLGEFGLDALFNLLSCAIHINDKKVELQALFLVTKKLSQAAELDCHCQEVVDDEDSLRRSIVSLLPKAVANINFEKLPCNLQYAYLKICCGVFSTCRVKEILPALLGFENMLNALCKDGSQEVFELVGVLYDFIRLIRWEFCEDWTELKVFNKNVVSIINPYFRQCHVANDVVPRNKSNADSQCIKICYLTDKLSHRVMPSVLLNAMLRGHAKLNSADVKIFLYSLVDDTKSFVNKDNLVFRVFNQSDSLYDSMSDIYRQCEIDEIDVAIANLNYSWQTALFTMRIAPIQIYLPSGFFYWDLDELDYILVGLWLKESNSFRTANRAKLITIAEFRVYFEGHQFVTDDVIQNHRIRFPKDKLLIGNLCRLSNISLAYLNLLKEILETEQRLHGLIAGSGDATLINNFIIESGLADRLTLINTYVDKYIYLSLLDILLDIFPIIGGIATLEAMSLGVPAVCKWQEKFGDCFYKQTRDESLCFSDDDAIIRACLELVNDNIYYQEKSKKAKEISLSLVDEKRVAESIETQISSLVKKHRAG